ncbi:tyrosine-type recombinase/integrase [Jatrophihabitans lederbergiae]|jgi:integrase/recombinase XerD|uniref:Tyrosine-type recombinase/integrase n=1 Tax=Jatrophihabitans lederbergiae TaxID=3075547 RepID=A0ABU2JID1_9ACTN|nr:tyrosine-type recombinase/integrase [Jatrophihabitans sp. DSM 44399]MDT0264478.1 tyrosine-type recombinase/integrase [Jatrophihabitans sp. DSM 44399]
MSDLAPLLQGFFTDKLIRQRQASPHTIAAYRDAITLLLGFVHQSTGRQPATLSITDLDAVTIGAFLQHLETNRGNTASTRNARLAAIHSLFRYAALRDPEHAALIQRVLAIPPKRLDRAIVSYLTRPECDALIAAPDRTSWLGRRDHALLLLAIQTGLRVSELTGLTCANVHLETGAHVRCHGKGRKDRCTPLTRPTVTVVRGWLAERRGSDNDPLFPSSRSGPLSRDAVQRRVTKHAKTARDHCPSLTAKTVTPHTLRHSCAMALLAGGVDVSVIALWLGHESTDVTQIYLHADMAIKERALTRLAPAGRGSAGRYKPPDKLLAFLDSL